jgi:hypothetical protein
MLIDYFFVSCLDLLGVNRSSGFVNVKKNSIGKMSIAGETHHKNEGYSKRIVMI